MRHVLVVSCFAVLAACSVPGTPPIRSQPKPAPDGRPALLVDHPLTERIASYRIQATLDPAKHEVVATETLTWKHNGNQAVDAVPLHLYLNAFKNETSVFMKESHGSHREFRHSDAGWGWIDVPSIEMDGQELRPSARYGEDETTLMVPLAHPVAPGETLTLNFRFTSHLPEVFARTGYKGDFMLIGQWFPKIGVLTVEDGAQTWHCDTFHANSEFFADFGTYDVEITAPDTHVVAATGVLAGVADAGGGKRKHSYRAEDVHDFVFMADPFMQVEKTTARSPAGPVEVRVYHRPAQAEYAARHVEAAKRTIERFSALFVPYPWPIMSVIDPPPDALGAGGMEYPTLVTTAADVDAGWQHQAEFVTVHEVGHNWFQGMLASNEVDEAFLDEGINEYADGIVIDEWFGADRSAIDGRFGHMGHYQMRSFTNSDGLVSPIATRSYEFAAGQYGATTYNKVAVAMKTLENLAGRDRFFAALGLYARRTAFHHPTRADLFAALKEGLGGTEDWTSYLDQMFLGTGGVDFRLSDVTTRKAHPPRGVFGEGDARKTVDKADESSDKADGKPAQWESWFSVHSRGKVHVPVEIDARFADGSVEHLTWDGRGGSKKFELTRPSALQLVVVDPGGKVPLEYEVLENSWSEDSQSGAAWRAAARASFWQQTLAQVVGL